MYSANLKDQLFSEALPLKHIFPRCGSAETVTVAETLYAHFKRAASGKLLYGQSGELLHGASGALLYDGD